MAQAGLANERIQALRMLEQLNQIKLSNGGLTEAARIGAENTLATLDTKIATETQKASFSTAAEAAAHKQAIKQLKQSSDAIRAHLGQPAKYGSTPEGIKASPAKKYKPGSVMTSPSTGKTYMIDDNGNPQEQGAPAQ
jgi:hypothetical protein